MPPDYVCGDQPVQARCHPRAVRAHAGWTARAGQIRARPRSDDLPFEAHERTRCGVKVPVSGCNPNAALIAEPAAFPDRRPERPGATGMNTGPRDAIGLGMRGWGMGTDTGARTTDRRPERRRSKPEDHVRSESSDPLGPGPLRKWRTLAVGGSSRRSLRGPLRAPAAAALRVGRPASHSRRRA